MRPILKIEEDALQSSPSTKKASKNSPARPERQSQPTIKSVMFRKALANSRKMMNTHQEEIDPFLCGDDIDEIYDSESVSSRSTDAKEHFLPATVLRRDSLDLTDFGITFDDEIRQKVKKEPEVGNYTNSINSTKQNKQRATTNSKIKVKVESQGSEDDSKLESPSDYFPEKKKRKIRTTITKDKLAEMNRIFAQYAADKESGKNPEQNLKEIGNYLSLGYSTILHKFREFRATKKVKGGALIASLQKKRKYRKSLEIENIIRRSLEERTFYTAVELSKYIFQRYGHNYSRSIISRHLGEMGYSYKNVKNPPAEKNKNKYKEARKLFAQIMLRVIDEPYYTIVYVDEALFGLDKHRIKKEVSGRSSDSGSQSIDECDNVSVIVLASCEKVLYYQILEGYFNHKDFYDIIKELFSPLNKEKIILVLSCNKIHRNNLNDEYNIDQVLSEENIYYLPPISPQLNPVTTMLDSVRSKIAKKEWHFVSELKSELENAMVEVKGESTEVFFMDQKEWLEKAINKDNF